MMNFTILAAGFIGKVHASNIHDYPHSDLSFVYDVYLDAKLGEVAKPHARVRPPRRVFFSDRVSES